MADQTRRTPYRFSPYAPRHTARSEEHTSSSGCISGPDSSPARVPELAEPLSDLDELAADDVTQVRRGVTEELGADDSSLENEVFLCVVLAGGRFGAASFDATTLELKIFTDVAQQGDHSCLEAVIAQVKPGVVALSSKDEDDYAHVLKELGVAFEILPTLDFGIDASRRRLLTLSTLPGLKADMSEEERTIYMSSLVPMDSINMVRAAGALIKYLDRKRVGVELEDPGVPIPIISIKVCTTDSMMLVDNNSFRALQIFCPETHPSVFKAGKYKEGLSLFGILNRTRTAIGAKKLRGWFLRPLRDMSELTDRQLAIGFMVEPRYEEAVHDLLSCLKHVKAMPRIIAKMKTANASVADWQALYKTSYNALKIGDVCRQLPRSIPVLRKIADGFTNNLYEIASLINKVVDFQQSVDQGRFVVIRGVDPQLDEKKNTYHGLPDFMTKVAEQELAHLDSSIQECSVIYLPQLGYLLSIPVADGATEDDDFGVDGLEFMFLSNRTAHYKSQSTRELDALLGDTQCEIIDHETSIMHQLQTVILEHSKTLLDVMELSSELDCLLSLAQSAREFNFTKPELSQENVVHIQGGRHPLQELCVNQFVANDTQFDAASGRIKVLTGPNASGKSVYLKQVGLIIYMAHIGSFVPADSAVIGLRDRLFTRITTLETVSVNLSTFMLDINQVTAAVQNSTKNSLILMDEFGKGTATLDGVSLFCALLRHWIDQGESCPMILSSTHFHSVLRQGFLPASPLLQFQMMETIMDGEEVVFLHQLVDGVTGKSHASHVATAAGLPPEIVQRSTQVSTCLNAGRPIPPLNSKQSEEEFSRLAGIVDEFLELDLESADVAAFVKHIASRSK